MRNKPQPTDYKVVSFLLAFLIGVPLCGVAAAATAQNSESEETFEFVIPSQPLAEALVDFSRITRRQVSVESNAIRDISSNEVVGTLSAHDGLNALVAGTGLELVNVNGRSFALRLANRVPGEPLVEEVIVRGQKRDTTLLDSDISVSVFTAADIENNRIRDLRRLDDLVPNVQFNQSGQVSSVFATIRGIESNQGNVNRAALYFDGIPFRELSNTVLSQISSIEVLRGPQGTLYGANSEAGLFIINSRQPRDKAEAELRLSTGFYNGDESYLVDGFIGGPIVEDTLFASLSMRVTEEDAFNTNPFSIDGESGNLSERFYHGRVSFEPTDALTIKATAYYLDVEAPGLFENELIPLNREAYDTAPVINFATGEFLGTVQNVYHGGRALGEFEFFSDVPKITTETDIVAGVSANQKLPHGELDFALSYSHLKEDSQGLDTDGTAFPFQAGFSRDDDEIWSAELRYTSPDSDIFEYILGGYWYKEERIDDRNITFFNPLTNSYNPFQPIPEQRTEGEDLAIFGSATAYLGIEGLSASLGLRYDRAERSSLQQGYTIAFGFQNIEFLTAEGESDFDQILPRAALSYKPNDHLHYYVSAAKGWIPGGFNLAASADPTVAEDILTFDEESVWSYELGMKLRFPDGNGYLNLAAFYIESDGWQEIQVRVDPDTGAITTPTHLATTANIESRGFEIEAFYKPTESLTLSAALGYTDAVYRDYEFAIGQRGQVPVIEGLDGTAVKLVPEYDLNLSARYSFGGGFFAEAEINSVGDTPLEERSRDGDPNTGRAVQEAVWLYNAYAGYEWDKFLLTLYAENISDERMASGLAFANLLTGWDGTFYAPISSPRVVGFELTVRF
ncbi:MAG: TonB-dependent receptor [Pseudomonadota bacterium]